jgi:hypothetical protein
VVAVSGRRHQALRAFVGYKAAVSSVQGRLKDGFMVLAHILAYAFMEKAVD